MDQAWAHLQDELAPALITRYFNFLWLSAATYAAAMHGIRLVFIQDVAKVSHAACMCCKPDYKFRTVRAPGWFLPHIRSQEQQLMFKACCKEPLTC
jgi:hypothetical protein